MPPSNRNRKIRNATRKLRGEAKYTALRRLLQANRFNKIRRGLIPQTRKVKLSKKDKAKIKELVSMNVNAGKSLARRSARLASKSNTIGKRANVTASERSESASSARAATAKRTANARSAARAEPDLESLANLLGRTVKKSTPYKSAPTHHLATSAERRRRLATIAEGENESSNRNK